MTPDSQPTEPQAPQSPPRTRAVIFDLDGVLVWSMPMHHTAFQRTFAAEGREFPLDEYRQVALGASREEVIRRVLGDLPHEKMRRLMSEKERHVKEYLRQRGIELIPGAIDFVRAVRARNVKTAVASASRIPEVILDSVGVLPLFDAVVGRGKVRRSKPHPDLYLLAAETLGVPPEECLVLEDSPTGIDAALNAGMHVLAITTTEDAANLSRAHGVYPGFADISLDEWIG